MTRRWLIVGFSGLVVVMVAVMVKLFSPDTSAEADANVRSDANAPAEAIFAGGCFWCMEPPFEKMDGVLAVISGYTGGHVDNPTYAEVSAGGSGHAEAVKVLYDPARVSYERLLDVFWRQIDPTDPGGQFADRGPQYRTAIFYLDEEQRVLAEKSKERLENSGKFDRPIVVEIAPATEFYEAEKYHQDYYKKNPTHYKRYRAGSGREAYIKNMWGASRRAKTHEGESGNYARPPDDEIKKKLAPLQYRVTQRNGTEAPFNNEYWDNKREGIYVDVVSGEPLFSSTHKYKSGTGWPSFTEPLVAENVVEREDRSLFTVRAEVRSVHGDSHLGHLFNDGPPLSGLRYCINSAALRFVPAEKLDEEGYGQFRRLFE